jgi:hypothetical protein
MAGYTLYDIATLSVPGHPPGYSPAVQPPSGNVTVSGSANVGSIVPGGRIGIQ